MVCKGLFFLDQNGNWKVQSDSFVSVQLDSVNPLIYSKFVDSFGGLSSYCSKSFKKFILTDVYGNKYMFGGEEPSINYSYEINYHLRDANRVDCPMYNGNVPFFANSWYIKEIQIQGYNDKMVFEYERGPFISYLY